MTLNSKLWANLIYNTDGDAAISLENFRKPLIIELLNEQGVVRKHTKSIVVGSVSIRRCLNSMRMPTPSQSNIW